MADRNAVVVSSPAPPAAGGLGRDNYSYSFAVRQFRPLLGRWGQAREVNRPESRVEFAVRRLRQDGLAPLHLGFSPLHAAYLAADAPNAAFVFWEYPDLPAPPAPDDPRYRWADVADRFDRLFTASTFAAEAFRRAGVRTPVEVVPVPVEAAGFEVPDWRPGQSVTLDVPSYQYPLPFDTPHVAVPGAPPLRPRELLSRRGLRAVYRACVKPLVPRALLDRVRRAVDRAVFPVPTLHGVPVPVPVTPRLELSGVVYLHVCNLFDPRKNWEDLLAAFLDGLGDRPDATLVIKLVADGPLLPNALNAFNTFYLELDRVHTCRVVLVGGYLSDEQMRALVGASTYYATATRAEGANLPLMDALAAGRPALCPRHTSMCDYFGPDLGWVVPSTEEPTAVAIGGERLISRWHRVDSAALAAQFRASYELARGRPDQYRDRAAAARSGLRAYAHPDRVWPALRAALDRAAGGTA